MDDPDLFTHADERERAKAARDAGMDTVEENAGLWMDAAFSVIHKLPSGWTGIFEDIRLLIRDAIGNPHHHNAYGALSNKVIRAHLLEPTGSYRHMRTERSHARRTPVYRRTVVR